MKWFRAYHSILDSVRVRTLPEGAQLDFWLLLCCASEFRERTGRNTGETGLTVEDAIWRTRRATLQGTFPELMQRELATLDPDGYIVMCDWEKRQFNSDDVAQRTSKSKKNRKNRANTVDDGNVPSDVPGNVPGNVRDTDTDTDLTTRENVHALPGNLTAATWDAWLQHRKEKGQPVGPTEAATTLATLRHHTDPEADVSRAIRTGLRRIDPPGELRHPSTHRREPTASEKRTHTLDVVTGRKPAHGHARTIDVTPTDPDRSDQGSVRALPPNVRKQC